MNKLQKQHRKEVSRKRKRAALRLKAINDKKHILNLVRKDRLVSFKAEKLNDTSAATDGLATVSS